MFGPRAVDSSMNSRFGLVRANEARHASMPLTLPYEHSSDRCASDTPLPRPSVPDDFDSFTPALARLILLSLLNAIELRLSHFFRGNW
jgi:hypothetical protein